MASEKTTTKQEKPVDSSPMSPSMKTRRLGGPRLITPEQYAHLESRQQAYQLPKSKFDQNEIDTINRELAELSLRPQNQAAYAQQLLWTKQVEQRAAIRKSLEDEADNEHAECLRASGAPQSFVDAVLAGEQKKDGIAK